METIPEDGISGLDSSPLLRSSPERAHSSSPSLHPHTSHDHLHPSLSRRRSDDGHVSFEPIIEPSRRSLDESRQSSLYGGFFNSSRGRGASPSSSRVYLRDLASRVRRKGAESDEASSSHHSASEEYARADEARRKGSKRRHFFKPPELDLVLRTQPNSHAKAGSEADTPAEAMSSPRTAVQAPRELKTPLNDSFTRLRSPDQPQSASQRLDTASTMVQKAFSRRVSLPTSPRHSWTEEEEEQKDEEAEQDEYERRAQ